ncbi:MAG TPA: DNA primase [Rectinemataceae bacterium]
MGRFPESLLQEILDKTNFAGVYQERLKLVKKGSKLWGLCPFHTEKTPSFSVDADRGLFYCFGCQRGGSLIDFIMEVDKLSFVEAVEELAAKAGVPLPKESPAQEREETERSQLLELYERLATTFHWFLVSNEVGSEALEMLKSRAVPESLIEEFRLGYAPADTSWLHRFLGNKGYSDAFLARTGLFAARNPRFPLFFDRIIFPIADHRGRVIAFGGRLLHGDGPKYINSPDTPIFHKQEQLFALDKALPAIKAGQAPILCEGYMDALSFHAAGLRSAIAPLGTAFTLKQAQSLKRRTDRVNLCFDSDQAGQKAAERACATAAAAGLESSVLLMRAGKDASEILEKQGPEALKKITEYSISSGDFLIRRAEELFDWATMDGKSKASSFFYPYLDALDSEVAREGFLEQVAKRMGINPSALRADYQKAKQDGGRRPERFSQAAGQTDKARGRAISAARTADLFFLTAVALKPESFRLVRENVGKDDLDDPRSVELYAALEEVWASGQHDTVSVVSRLENEQVRRFVLETAAAGELDEGLDEVVADGIKTVAIRSLEREQARIVLEVGRVSRAETGSENLVELLKRKMQIDTQIARIKGKADE